MGITSRHYNEFLSEKIKKGEFVFPDSGKTPITVTRHDSCHMGRVSGVSEGIKCRADATGILSLLPADHPGQPRT